MLAILATEYHPQSPKRRVQILRDNTPVGGDVVDPGKTSEIKRKICKPYNVSEALVREALAKLNTAIPYGDAAVVGPVVFTVRPRHAPDGVEFTNFADAIAAPAPPDSVIAWKDARFACLDIDVDAPISTTEAERAASLVRPRPHLWHQSHNGGLHCYYHAAHGYSGLDLAACAAVWIRQFNSLWRCELKEVTRHPAQTGYPIVEQTASPDVSHILAWVRADADNAGVEELLEEKGWVLGQRLAHTHCPIEPIATSRGSDAVLIGQAGVYCFRCAGLGLQKGSRRPGFVPWSHFVNGALCSAVRSCVRNFTHWSQASIVLAQEYNFPEDIAQRAYGVLLRLWHGEDVRIGRVGAGENLIRRKGQWMYLDGSPLKLSHGKRELAALPAVQDVEGKVIGPMLDRFCQATDLSPHGYSPVEIVHGVSLWGQYLPYPDGRIATVQYNGPPEQRPRYRAMHQRLSLVEVKLIYERHFPDLPWEYLQLLICARGVAEGASGMPPFLYVHGSTGAGKTQTTHLAAATLGDYASEVNWSNDNQRFRQGILEAVQRGTFAVVNEIRKGAQRVRMGIDLAMEPILTLTEHSTSHQLYTGPVALGRLPVVVMTETSLPDELLRVAQLTRRLISVQLHRKLDWDLGIGAKVQILRSLGPDVCHAADSLLSWMVDLHFREPKTLAMVAESLGFQRMENVAEDKLKVKETLLALFRATCNAPDAAPSHQRRWGGRGWKLVDQGKGGDEANLLDYLYFILSDTSDFTQSGAIQENDWTGTLGLSGEPVECQLRPISPQHRSQIGIRFKRGGLINAEIVAP